MPAERAVERAGVSPEIIDALVGDDGPAFCQFLRVLYYNELRAGHVLGDGQEGDPGLLRRARALGLVQTAGSNGPLRFTEIGYEVANVAKEYTNWIDGGSRLPEGVTPAMLEGKRVLDVGCSFGRYLRCFATHGARVTGIDFQETYLRLSASFARHQTIDAAPVSRARAEQLPFVSRAFDFVFCRLVLNYVSDVDGTIGEFARVLVPGGTLVLIVEPMEAQLRHLATNKWLGNGHSVAFTLFGLFNTAVLQVTGKQMVIRRKGRMHAAQSPAWPTAGWLNRRLAAHGFTPLEGNTLRDPQRVDLYRGRLTTKPRR